MNGETNPYRHLLPEGLIKQSFDVIASTAKGVPLCVELNGGIGDHLEALSLLPWAKAHSYHLNLLMGARRLQQIEPLLPSKTGSSALKTR